MDAASVKTFSYESFIPFFEHIKRHKYFYRINLQARKEFPIKQGYEQIWNTIVKPFCQNAGIFSEKDMAYYFAYFQAGFTMVLKRWVDHNCLDSEEHMAQLVMNCVPAVFTSLPDI